MAEKKDGTRSYDAPNANALAEFMKGGWAPTPLEGVKPVEHLNFVVARRAKISAKFPTKRLIFPAGAQKVRSNDTHFKFRAHTEFTYYSGILAKDVVPESVLILEPNGSGHDALLFVHPRSSRDSEEFYRNAETQVIKEIEKRTSVIAQDGSLPPAKVQCTECTKPFEIPLVFDYSAFFGQGS